MLSKWLHWKWLVPRPVQPGGRKGQALPRAKSTRLSLEPLESRELLTVTSPFNPLNGALTITITVNNQSSTPQNVTVSAGADGRVWVNDKVVCAPGGRNVKSQEIRSITVYGSSLNNCIDLSRVGAEVKLDPLTGKTIPLWSSALNRHIQIYGRGGADKIWGSQFDDYIRGDDGNDSIWGNNGNDILYGDAGDDYLDGGASVSGKQGNVLSGGAGRDIFIGTPNPAWKDWIVDFNQKVDQYPWYAGSNWAIEYGVPGKPSQPPFSYLWRWQI